MSGTILEVINGGSIWLLLVDVGGRLVDQPVEPRYMSDIVQGEGLASPAELVGRQVDVADDGMTLEFI